MLDSIQLGMSGLLGFSQGLRVIGNNTVHMNTPGYKSATLQFTDYLAATPSNLPPGRMPLGQGLITAGTTLDFRAGDLRQTGNALDLGVDGEGFFILRDAQGHIRYTRAGQFEFNQEGLFVNRTDGSQVMALNESGAPIPISMAGLRAIAGTATTKVRFTGNLSSTAPDQTVDAVKVYDALGTEHTLSVKFTNTGTTTPNSWTVELIDQGNVVGQSQILFSGGTPTTETATLSFDYTPAGAAPLKLTLDFASDVTSFASGNLSTLAMSSQDGTPAGQLTNLSFDSTGTLVATCSNGRTAKGARLGLAQFPSTDAVQSLGGSDYAEANGIAWTWGHAGEGAFGKVSGGVLESSNVDLSSEFSKLVIMQRGYQGSSQIVSTANEMLEELFRMKGGK